MSYATDTIEGQNAVAKLLSRKDMTRAELARRCIEAEHNAMLSRNALIDAEHTIVDLKGQLAAPITTPTPLSHSALMAIARKLSMQDKTGSYRVGLGCVERFNRDTKTWAPVQL